MRWGGLRRSTNVSDRRGMGGMAVGGGVGAVLIALVAMLLGVDPGAVVPSGGGEQPPAQGAPAANDEGSEFVRRILGSTEDVWRAEFPQQLGRQYQDAQLELFSGATQSGCGFAQAQVGPFYCPRNGTVYIDLSFYEDLQRQLGAPGDFAQAYVIAHEVGHHVQNLLGLSDRVHSAQQTARSEAEANQLSVMLELQADCLAGIWGYHLNQQRTQEGLPILQEGDVEEALNAASAIGDDRLQKRSQGHVVPESFTHGSSEQRVRWFQRGFQTGSMEQCDTFYARSL
jgi:predicted metalloprotease